MAEHVKSPTRSEVVERLRLLVSGKISREQASDWASPWITKFDQFVLEDRIWDRKIKNALECLAMADTPTSDREYLFEKVDFEAWLKELTKDL